MEARKAAIPHRVDAVERLHAELLRYARRVSETELGEREARELEDLLRSANHLHNISDTVAVNIRSLLHEWAIDDLAQVADELQAATEHEVPISWSSPDGRTGPALVDAGADAALLVVGRHDGDGHERRPMTSALHHVLTHAPCPVVVVPVVETDG